MLSGRYLWSAGIARHALDPGLRTGNPTPAAARLLGKRTVSRARRGLRRAGKRRAFRGNPIPAVASVISSLGVNLFKYDKKKMGERADYVRQVALRASGASTTEAPRAAGLNVVTAKAELDRIAQGLSWPGQWAQIRDVAKSYQGHVMETAPAAAQGGVGGLLQTLQSPAGGQLIRAVASTARRSRRPRYPTYIDRYGRQRYSYKPPGSSLRLPAGATMAAGTPYNFFTGAVGQGGAAATAGQVAVAAAAGVGAYLVTQRLLQYLGGRAQSKEEAGVNAAKALHQALEDYKQQHGQYPPPAERAAMKQAYQQKLVELGYDPVTFTRTRSGFEQFLEDYNPLGG